MDRESTEKMAPALHTIEHESTSASIKSFKMPQSSPSTTIVSESNIFDEINGDFLHDMNEEIQASDVINNSKKQMMQTEYKTSQKFDSNNDPRTDTVSFTSKPADKELRGCTLRDEVNQPASGDATSKAGTNGWPEKHKLLAGFIPTYLEKERTNRSNEIIKLNDSNGPGLPHLHPTFLPTESSSSVPTFNAGGDASTFIPSPSVDDSIEQKYSNKLLEPNADITPGINATTSTGGIEENDIVNATKRIEVDKQIISRVAFQTSSLLSSTFLNVDKCNFVSSPDKRAPTITTTAVIRTATETTSSVRHFSSQSAVTSSPESPDVKDSSECLIDFKDSHANVDCEQNDVLPPTSNNIIDEMQAVVLVQLGKSSALEFEYSDVLKKFSKNNTNFTTTASIDTGAHSFQTNTFPPCNRSFVTSSCADSARTTQVTNVDCVGKPSQELLDCDEHNLFDEKASTVDSNLSKTSRSNCPNHHELNLKSPWCTPVKAIKQEESSTVVSSSDSSFHVNTVASVSSAFVASANFAGCSTATTVVYASGSTISSNCEQKSFPEHKVSGSVSPKDNGLLLTNAPDLANLAHDIMTGNHMQNLPLKLTNTLQELAASLAGEHEENVEARLPVASSNCSTLAASTKKIPSENCNKRHIIQKISNIEEISTQHKVQHTDVLKRTVCLENQIYLLRKRLNALRAAGIAKHAQSQLTSLTTRKADQFSTLSICHQKQDQLANYQNHSNSNASQAVATERGLRHRRSLRSHKSVNEIGVLKKEMRHVRREFDPDLTDSSSDEETQAHPRKKLTEETQASSDGLGKASSEKAQTSARAWGHERTSVGHRWTWIDAQVTGLEYKIQQYDELHRQLRATKGKVILGHQVFPKQTCADDSFLSSAENSKLTKTRRNSDGSINLTSTMRSPCDFHQLVSNNRQTLNSLDNISRLPAGSRAAVLKSRHDGSLILHRNHSDEKLPISTEKLSTSARTRPLKHHLRSRKIIRLSTVSLLNYKKLKPPIVRNENEIVEKAFSKHTPFHRGDGRSRGVNHSSMSDRAAFHDHSYHKILSTPEDIPVSLRVNAHMMTNNSKYANRSKKAESMSEKRKKQKQKEAKRRDDRLMERIRSRPRSATVVLERADKLIRSVSALQRNTSMEDRSLSEHRRRRSTAQMMSDYNRRHRITSVDSDAESNHHRSEYGTPVFDKPSNPHYQAVLKRKRASEQAFDINNIVIPYGLTTNRIEKLQYKEIITPGWRPMEKLSAESAASAVPEEDEDLSNDSYQTRHDRYEIMEKKKYMAYVEWNMNKKNGTRSLSRANLPLDEEASSFFYPSLSLSPTNPFAPADFPSPASPESLRFAMVRTRRTSSDQSLHNSASSHPVDRRRVSVSSEDGSSLHRENSTCDAWERRTFPLGDMDVEELIKEPVVCLTKLPKDFETDSTFRPISVHTNNADTHSTAKHRNSRLSDHAPLKRRRTDSHVSNLSRDDDRHSDDSNSSSMSKRHAREKISLAVSPIHPLPKRHKPTHKDDFYYYNELESASDSGGSSEDEPEKAPGSGDEHASTRKPAFTGSGQWVAKAVSRESTPPARRGASVDEYVFAEDDSPKAPPPLVIKIKKK